MHDYPFITIIGCLLIAVIFLFSIAKNKNLFSVTDQFLFISNTQEYLCHHHAFTFLDRKLILLRCEQLPNKDYVKVLFELRTLELCSDEAHINFYVVLDISKSPDISVHYIDSSKFKER